MGNKFKAFQQKNKNKIIILLTLVVSSLAIYNSLMLTNYTSVNQIFTHVKTINFRIDKLHIPKKINYEWSVSKWVLSPESKRSLQNSTTWTTLEKVWIEFGRIQNLKCIDYFRVTYEKTDKTGVTTITTDPINRHEKGAQMTVVPCTLYKFK